MSPESRGKLRAEADLIARFAEVYRQKFTRLIDQMNHQPDSSLNTASLKLCVEAVDMMLFTQRQLAHALCELSTLRKAA